MLYRNEKIMLRMPMSRLLFRDVYWFRFEFGFIYFIHYDFTLAQSIIYIYSLLSLSFLISEWQICVNMPFRNNSLTQLTTRQLVTT